LVRLGVSIGGGETFQGVMQSAPHRIQA